MALRGGPARTAGRLGAVAPPCRSPTRPASPASSKRAQSPSISGARRHSPTRRSLSDPGRCMRSSARTARASRRSGRIFAGVLAPDGGEVFVRGEPVSFRSPREALEHGIAAIGQEPSVVPQLSVAENVFLGSEPTTAGIVRRRALRKRYEALMRSAGFDLRGDRPARSLRVAEQQEVEILRALSRAAEVVIMDEPTAALSGAETARLHEIVRSLAAQGKTILLISHFLREVLELADTVTVLRDGRVIRTAPTAAETEASLVEAMLGRPLEVDVSAQAPAAVRHAGRPGDHGAAGARRRGRRPHDPRRRDRRPRRTRRRRTIRGRPCGVRRRRDAWRARSS